MLRCSSPAAESLLLDRKDARAALDKLRAIAAAARTIDRCASATACLTADALEASGQRDGAAAVVQALLTEYPDVVRLKQRLDTLK